MTWVKVCGLTSESDVSDAIDAGADALGFVLADGSPRRVSAQRAAVLMDGVPALRILVTVDTAPDMVADMVEATGADGIQPHGRDAAAVALWAKQAGFFVLRPIGRGSVDEIPDGQIPLLDSAAGDRHGGTGIVLDWSGIHAPERPFVLGG